MNFGKLSTAKFLREYWQKKPLLIREALADFVDPVSPEELAGLACEEDVEARLVFTRKGTWKLETGPFRETDFTALPARNWTLLVQAVDQWIPEIKAMLDEVSFLPNWRIDDVMVSYATPNGGVGPHFDYYDVFLVQGQGSRVWRTGQRCTSKDVSRTGSGLKLLEEFVTEQEWLLKPGDVLYVPPGVAHWGISVDNSLCYSLGFRAPSLSEMVLGYSDACSDQATEDERFEDPALKPVRHPGEMNEASLQKMRRMLQRALDDKLEMNLWFGRHMTQPKNPDLFQSFEPGPGLHHHQPVLAAHPAARFAWQVSGAEIFLFANGEMIRQPASPKFRELVQQLCIVNSRIASAAYIKHKACRVTLEILLAQGALLIEE